MKKRVAIWLHGGIGTGHFGQGMPVLENVVGGLANHYHLVVYSQHAPQPGYSPPNFIIKSAPPSMIAGWRRWLWVVSRFLTDHRKEKFDVVFAFWGYPAGLIATALARIKKIHSVVYLRGSDAARVRSNGFGIFNSAMKTRLALWTYRNCSILIVLTEYQKKELIKFGVSRTINVVPSGVDPSQFFFAPKERSPKLRLIQVAHLNVVKNQKMLLQTFAEILKSQDAELRIIGFDTMHGQIQQLARDMNIASKVVFSDVLPNAQLLAQYRWADIFIQTSFSEGQGMAATEAAACGVLIAGTRVGIIYDLDDDATIAVGPDDHETLARKIVQIADKPLEWEHKTASSLQWSRKHTLLNTVSALESLINSLG